VNYQKKVKILGVITGSLALVYAALIIFSPDRISVRNDYYTWLEKRTVELTERVDIQGENPITLLLRDGVWVIVYDGEEYPAREGRVEDLLAALSAREAYPLRGNSASAHDRLGLGDESERRILLWRGAEFTGAEQPLLDLIIGGSDAAGREIYYRRQGRDEVRSGSARIAGFLDLRKTSWYELRLFPESGDVTINQVSRVTVIPPTGAGEAAALIINRDAAGWFIEGLAREKTEIAKIEPYIKSILSMEADDYVPAADDDFSSGRIVLETPRRTLYIRLGEEISEGAAETETPSVKRRARISPSNRVVALSTWSLDRLFRDAAYFTLAEVEEF
jgi:hypothetical protein